MSATLLLGSQSNSRQILLRHAQIPFRLISQIADETACDWGVPLKQLVETIAIKKMEHVSIPHDVKNEYCFVLTADTLSQDHTGTISGKPTGRDDAIKKIKIARKGMRTATAFCLDKKRWDGDIWKVDERIITTVASNYIFDVSDKWIDAYFDKSIGYRASGAIAIEDFGSQFLKSIDGSYSAVVGLPLFELRCALSELGFFSL